MATNNAINLKSSGIVSYDGAGAFSALADPLIVSNGGTGVASFTAYSVLTAGTTATGNFQNVSGVGSSTDVLTSNGSAALPTWGTYPTFRSMLFWGKATASGAGDGVTYYIGNNVAFNTFTSSTGGTRFYIPISGTVTKCLGSFTMTAGSSQPVTIALRKNDTSNTTVQTVTFDAATVNFSNTGLSISISAGDFMDFIVICPTWTPTNPINVTANFSFLVT